MATSSGDRKSLARSGVAMVAQMPVAKRKARVAAPVPLVSVQVLELAPVQNRNSLRNDYLIQLIFDPISQF